MKKKNSQFQYSKYLKFLARHIDSIYVDSAVWFSIDYTNCFDTDEIVTFLKTFLSFSLWN